MINHFPFCGGNVLSFRDFEFKTHNEMSEKQKQTPVLRAVLPNNFFCLKRDFLHRIQNEDIIELGIFFVSCDKGCDVTRMRFPLDR